MITRNPGMELTSRPWTVTCDCCGSVIPGKYFEVNENGSDVHYGFCCIGKRNSSSTRLDQ